MKVLVYGASGSQASPVVSELINQGHDVRAFSRDKAKAAPRIHPKAEIFEGDMLDFDATLKASQGMEAIALHIPTFMGNQYQAAQNAIKAAQNAGIKLIVWNASGVILPERIGNPTQDIRLDVKALLEESEIPNVILQPTVYAENLLGPWTAPFVKEQAKVAYPTPADFEIAWLPSIDMAKLMVAALTKPELVGKGFVISGKQNYSGLKLAKVFEEALGRPIEYYAMPPSEFGQILDSIMGPGAGAAIAKEYQAIWDGKAKPTMAVEMQAILDLFEVEFTDLADWIKSYEKLFS
ncbi:MAG: NmrA family NAD(P)-binding protein [Bacteroidota bacterium]